MGQSKALLPWGPETLLQCVVRQLLAVVQPVVVVAAPQQALPELPAGHILARDRQPDQGPLEGIGVGLQTLPAEVHYAYVTSCDAPLLRPAFLRELYRRRGSFDAVVPRDGKRHYPLAAIYHRRLARRIDELLRAGKRRPLDLFPQVDTLEIDTEQLRGADPDLSTLQNVNTPEEYEGLRAAGLPSSGR